MSSNEDEVVLYRGIALPDDSVTSSIARIKSDGLSIGDPKRMWGGKLLSVGTAQAELAKRDNITLFETRGVAKEGVDPPRYLKEIQTICATGDPEGASYYACVHNRSNLDTSPLVVTFKAKVARLSLDSRDFFVNAFQMASEDESIFSDQVRLVEQMFGERAVYYFLRARRANAEERIAWADLAAEDAEVVRSHYQNRITIEGRHRVIFRSAFFVELNVPASDIISVDPATYYHQNPSINLRGFQVGTLACK